MYALELAGEDDAFPAREAATAATDLDVVAPGLATAGDVVPERVRRLAFTHAACELLGRSAADVNAARALLSETPLDRQGTVAVRARDVRGTAGVDTQRAERELGAVLVERGFAVDLEDPDHELRALFSNPEGDPDGETAPAGGGVCLLGWLAVESVRDYGERAPTDRPFFQPGSMDPMLARALANLALAATDAPHDGLVLDPMCGTGGILVEAAPVGATVVGSDAQAKMVRGAARNLAHEVPDADWHILRADATRLPLADDAVDGAVFDAPYGRQSKVEGDDPNRLLAGALAEARRVAGRAVVVADRDLSAPAREAGWTAVERFPRRVHRSLVRHVHVLDRA